MDPLSEVEERLKVYEAFLRNPPGRGNFSEASYERRAYRVALRRAISDAHKLLRLLKTIVGEGEKPIPLTRIKK